MSPPNQENVPQHDFTQELAVVLSNAHNNSEAFPVHRPAEERCAWLGEKVTRYLKKRETKTFGKYVIVAQVVTFTNKKNQQWYSTNIQLESNNEDAAVVETYIMCWEMLFNKRRTKCFSTRNTRMKGPSLPTNSLNKDAPISSDADDSDTHESELAPGNKSSNKDAASSRTTYVLPMPEPNTSELTSFSGSRTAETTDTKRVRFSSGMVSYVKSSVDGTFTVSRDERGSYFY